MAERTDYYIPRSVRQAITEREEYAKKLKEAQKQAKAELEEVPPADTSTRAARK